jgi:hypothetical protein
MFLHNIPVRSSLLPKLNLERPLLHVLFITGSMEKKDLNHMFVHGLNRVAARYVLL